MDVGYYVQALGFELSLAFHVAEPLEAEHVRDIFSRQNLLRDDFSNCRRQFESMTRSSADEPYVAGLRMPIDNQISVRAVLILANLGRQQRRFCQLGKSFGKQMTRSGDPFGARQAIRVGRIDRLAARVVGKLEAAIVDIGNAVDDAFAEVDPDRQMARRVTIRSTRSPEVVDLLSGRTDPISNDIREDF